jgi:succinoglycan biosynthesis protein ExoO
MDYDFSVIIPAYNVSAIIERAIRSAAGQSLPPFEIIVIDDCSTDDTAGIVRAMAREIPSLRLLSTARNSGPSAARNIGLSAARGDWIALLDADDAWRPERLERLSAVAGTTGADFVADDLVMWDAGADCQVSQAYYDLAHPQRVTLLDMFRADDNFDFKKKTFSLMKPIMNRQFLVDHRIKYNEQMKIGEDFALYAESLFNGAKLFLLNEAHYVYSMPKAPSGRSPHSRSVYQVGGLSEMCYGLERRYADRIGPELREAMRRYRRAMTRLHESDVARVYKRNHQYARYFGYLGARPNLVRSLVDRSFANRMAV